MPKAPKPVTYTLTGTSGRDFFNLEDGQLTLNGSPRAVTAGATQISLNGGDGDDRIATDMPHNLGGIPLFFDGGRGIDTLDFSNSSQAVAVSIQQGNRPNSGSSWVATNFTLELNSAREPDYYAPEDPSKMLTLYPDSVQTRNILNIENLIGSANDDWFSVLTGVGARIDGGGGNDYILGGGLADQLIGGAGDDFLFGKAGNDVMTGNVGADQFQVLTNNGVDVVTDFNFAEGDRLYIGWQQSTDTLPTASSWYQTTWTDSEGVVHTAIRADFTGGGVILVDHTLADVDQVMSSLTIFDWFG